MDLLNKLIIPESLATLNLITVLLLMARIILLSFSGLLLAGTVLSLMKLNKKTNSVSGFNLSAEYINLGIFNNLIPVGFGIVPFLSSVLILGQMLYNAQTQLLNILIISFIMYLVAIGLLLIFRSSLNKNQNSAQSSISRIFGIFGFLLLMGSLLMFIAVISGLENMNTWETDQSFFNLLTSLPVVLQVIKYIFFSFSFTSVLLIYKLKLNGKFDQSVFSANQKIALRSWIVVLAISIIQFFLLPKGSFTTTAVLLVGLTALIMIVQIQLIVENQKFAFKFSSYSFVLAIIIFTLLNIIDHSSFAIAADKQVNILAAAYEKTEAASNTSVSETKIDGKEIYSVKCMACHRFDQKLVGPPHKDVMIKYADKKDAMIQFILKPFKVDPAYPDMPQQGLTPSEAKAVVEYMYQEFGSKLK